MSTSSMQEEHQQREDEPHPRGMQFISKMTSMGPYFYLRVPKERNETARTFGQKYVLVKINEVQGQ